MCINNGGTITQQFRMSLKNTREASNRKTQMVISFRAEQNNGIPKQFDTLAKCRKNTVNVPNINDNNKKNNSRISFATIA